MGVQEDEMAIMLRASHNKRINIVTYTMCLFFSLLFQYIVTLYLKAVGITQHISTALYQCFSSFTLGPFLYSSLRDFTHIYPSLFVFLFDADMWTGGAHELRLRYASLVTEISRLNTLRNSKRKRITFSLSPQMFFV
jgi:hypothetical protein